MIGVSVRPRIPFIEWREYYLANDDRICPLDEWHEWPSEPEYEAIPHMLNHGAQYAGLGIYLDYTSRYLPPSPAEIIRQRERAKQSAASIRAKREDRERERQYQEQVKRERQERERRQRAWLSVPPNHQCLTPHAAGLYTHTPPFTPSHTFTVDRATIHAIQNHAQSVLGTKACGQCWRIGLVAIVPDGDVGWNPDQRLWLLTSVCSGCGTRAVFAWSDTIAPARR